MSSENLWGHIRVIYDHIVRALVLGITTMQIDNFSFE
jgi:hypothetical protein